MHLRLAAKPGHLAFGVVAMALLRCGDGCRFGERAAQNCHCLPVSQSIQRPDGTEAIDQRTGFSEQALGEHTRGSLVDASVKLWSRRVEADAQKPEAGERLAPLGEQLRHGATRGQRNLQGADELGSIVGMDAAGSRGVQACEQAMQPSGTAPRMAGTQALAQLRVALRAEKKALRERAQIQPGAARDEGNDSASGDGAHGGASLARVVAGAEIAVRIADVEQMMPHQRAFGCSGLGRADLHAAIDGDRVATDDLDGQVTGQSQGKSGFAACGRPQQEDGEWRGLDFSLDFGLAGIYQSRHHPAGNHQPRGTIASLQTRTASATSTRPSR